MHLIHVAVAEETASTARHVSLAFMARERARACALCKKTCGHENGIRHMISGIGDKLREFYWRPVIGDVVVWERGGRNPVRSVIPATLIYLGASFARPRRRTMDQAGEKEWAEFVSASAFPPPPLEKIQDIRSLLPLGKQSAKLGHRTDCSLGGPVFKQLCEQFQSSFCLLILIPRAPTRIVSS